MSDFVLPSLGADMDAGMITEWYPEPGSRVSRGDVVGVVETAKGAIDLEIWVDGTIGDLLVEPGGLHAGGHRARPRGGGGAAACRRGRGAGVPSAAAPARDHRTRRRRRRSRPSRRAAPPVSPAARKQATDWASTSTAGRHGPRGCGHAWPTSSGRTPAPPPAASTVPPPAPPMDMRAAIAAAMSRSKREIPHYYLSETIPMDAAMDWLAAANAGRPITERLLPGGAAAQGGRRWRCGTSPSSTDTSATACSTAVDRPRTSAWRSRCARAG